MHVGRFEPSGTLGTCRTMYGIAALLAWPSFRMPRLERSRRHDAERRWASRITSLLEVNLAVSGLEHIEPGQPYVVASLHEGFYDAPALLHLPLDLAWVAREELTEWRALGRYLSATDQILLPDDASASAARQMRRRAAEIIDRGQSLVLFPQGTILGIETAFNRGAFWLADALDVPLLPVALAGSHRVWEHPFSPTLRFGEHVSVAVLPPLPAGSAESEMTEVEKGLKAVARSLGPPVRQFVPEHDGFWDGYRYEIDPAHPDLAATVARHRADSAAA